MDKSRSDRSICVPMIDNAYRPCALGLLEEILELLACFNQSRITKRDSLALHNRRPTKPRTVYHRWPLRDSAGARHIRSSGGTDISNSINTFGIQQHGRVAGVAKALFGMQALNR